MRTALVTGATGFVGSHLVRGLLSRRVAVHVLCRTRSDFRRLESVRNDLTVHPVSLADRGALRRVVRSIAPDHVLHLAGAATHGGIAPAMRDVVRANFRGTVNLIDACGEVEYASFINTGDAFEYGPGRGARKESQACRPATLEGITRLAATLYGQRAAQTRHMPIVTLRLFSVFGPQDDPRRLVPRVIAGARAGTPLMLSQPQIARDFLDVGDLIDLYLKVMRAGARLRGEIINAGSGRRTTIAEIVACVLRLTKSRSAVRWGAYPTAAHDGGAWVADISRAQRLLKWKPRTSLEDGLRRTIGAR
jgi:nucleoside-diphosphate-sugar epimerase